MNMYDYFYNGGREEWKEKEKTFTSGVEDGLENSKEKEYNPLRS